MGTIADKMNYLNTTKQKIKTVMNAAGCEIDDTTTFRNYATILNNQIKNIINNDLDLFDIYPSVSGSGTTVSLEGTDNTKLKLTLNPTELTQDGTPSPDSPVDVNVIKGNNTITISNSDNTQSQNYSINLGNLEYAKIGDYEDEIIETTGKNLFDKDNANLVQLIKASGGDYFVGSSGIKSFYIKVKPNTKYTIQKILSNRFNIYLSEEKPARNVAITTYVSRNAATSISITTGTNDNYLTVYFWVDSDTLTEQEILDTIMINEGEEMLPYEPYGVNELYLKENVGKVVLDGSESYTSSTAGGYRRFQTLISNAITLAGRNLVYSNYFKFSINTNYIGVIFLTNGNVYLYPNSDITSTTEFTNWLSINNTIIYYPLATPIFKKITDTTLIEQLENIHNNATSYDGQTNITQTNDDLPFDLEITALKKIDI